MKKEVNFSDMMLLGGFVSDITRDEPAKLEILGLELAEGDLREFITELYSLFLTVAENCPGADKMSFRLSCYSRALTLLPGKSATNAQL